MPRTPRRLGERRPARLGSRREVKIDPIDRDIMRAMSQLKLRVTPSKIASSISVHPATVQRRLVKLDKLKLTNSIKRGNRTYSKLNRVNLRSARNILLGSSLTPKKRKRKTR